MNWDTRCQDVMRFWRDPALPFLEARRVTGGRRVCYARHSHDTFSIGAITGGHSTYWNQGHTETVHPGTVVVMNPGEVHACNPIDDLPWSYDMLYIETDWLADLQQELIAAARTGFLPYAPHASRNRSLYRSVVNLCDALFDPNATRLARETLATQLVIEMQRRLDPRRVSPPAYTPGLERAASFIRAHCTEAIGLDDICQAAGLSRSYLVRRFKARFGLTPHAFLLDQRIQLGTARLRDGRPIAEVATDCGFADQAHFQRVFKRLRATTPGHYRRGHPPGR
ncbi:AraC family transcriptional regulator [Halomonas halmophila]|uniref:AraC family transcriptional regulator n=1 Tax=Halomonas halmophila TaxID=252 RepID=A0A4Y4ETJ5_9GAMM|nr:AraC family transcriptional regulator [Halomonas halmophila]GED21139.1 AraC family transcriptional regulator [Halomonas halmophila]